MIPELPYQAVMVELKNTLLQSSTKNVKIPINTFKSLLFCGATVEYQCGRITEDQYLARVAFEFEHTKEEIKTAISAVRSSMQINTVALSALRAIKAEHGDRLRIYAVTNLSRDDLMLVNALGIEWSIFDRVFVSCDLGMQKPELRFFNHILDAIGLPADQVVLLDDDTDNVLAALSLGFQDVLSLADPLSLSLSSLVNFDASGPGGQHDLRELMVDSPLEREIDPFLEGSGVTADVIERGERFLRQNAKNFPSYTHTGVPVKENFAQLLILEITGDRQVESDWLQHNDQPTDLLVTGRWSILRSTRTRGTFSSVRRSSFTSAIAS
jgi:FMN phosphatase YigB (HAD superfamily)